jgi:hypothetical protein
MGSVLLFAVTPELDADLLHKSPSIAYPYTRALPQPRIK